MTAVRPPVLPLNPNILKDFFQNSNFMFALEAWLKW